MKKSYREFYLFCVFAVVLVVSILSFAAVRPIELEDNVLPKTNTVKAVKKKAPPLPPMPQDIKPSAEQLKRMHSRIAGQGPTPPSKLTVLYVKADLESSTNSNGPWTVYTNITFATLTNPPNKMYFRAMLNGASTNNAFLLTENRKGVILYDRNPAVSNFPPVLGTVQVSLAWDPSVASNISGYAIYHGSTSRAYTNETFVGNITNATIRNLKHGMTYYFAATALDTSGLESDFSQEVSYMTPFAITNRLTMTFGVDQSPDMRTWAALGRSSRTFLNPDYPTYYRSVITLESRQFAAN